ncbi:leucyl aminopeptidase [Candidatus Bathyarchaeota archaeon]|nr:leucyl aminopeptidase [Candidatus Bathyarchaeota archaeon]
MKTIIKKQRLADADTPLLLVGVTEERAESSELGIPKPLRELAQQVVELGDFKGKKGDTSVVYTRGKAKPSRLMLVGLGKAEELTAETLRGTLGEASRRIRDLGVETVGVSLEHAAQGRLDTVEAAEAVVTAFILGSYSDPQHKTRGLDKFKHIEELQIVSPIASEALVKAVEEGRVIAESVNMCRTLAWGPGNRVTPSRLAEEAMKLKELGVKIEVFDREAAERIGLHSFVAVARGTEEPPRFIVMEYGEGETVALIGKAITFDTGGISLKSRDGMPLMKTDMTGGAIVISAMKAVARLGLPLHVVGVVPATDNMPSGRAYHPGDVVDTYSGLTVEVISTDAEGRMVLNDALSYAARNYKPAAMFDFATLTGSMQVALGEHAIGYFANDDGVAKRVEEASASSGERVWRMPLWEVYDQQLKSDVADWKHTGGRPGGAITAARFLSKFVEDVPWVHMDIAGLMEQSSDKGYNPKGSKGPGVRLIMDVLRNWGKTTEE